eukprot:CAMPEP_0171015036 /NCGR_PEP_ID=MMETSP0736-20130129/25605_1 /TAXON_ID=186038 /ORGANISM="Fragilariopsis kerguelensis, Strain L26-C5" /LENGTH=72 /DNA_ID=CAMNT_0011449619 /DNA_START=117 /DNA_END=332 /DNA_ORIENTATION=+
MTTASLTNTDQLEDVDMVLDVVVLTESNHIPTTSRMTTTSNNNKNKKKNQHAILVSTIVIGFVGVVSAAILW